MIAFLCAIVLFLEPFSWNGSSLLPSQMVTWLPPTPPLFQLLTVSSKQALERLFTSPQIQADWFVPEFLHQVPLPQVQGVVTDISNSLGSFQQVEETDDGFTVTFAKGVVPTRIRLTENGQIAGLFFQPPLSPIALEDTIAFFESFPDEASFIVIKDNDEMASVKADQPLAVGSTFKLAVLAALNKQIELGNQQWDTVVQLQPEWKSLPSGMMQEWADDSYVTLDTLATLMISISDNTASDALIQILGRETVEEMAEHNKPFLTTKEAFTLKNPDNSWLLRRYRTGDIENRRQVLQDSSDRPLPKRNLFTDAPVDIDVEWMFTTRELCSLMDSVAQLPVMQINPGFANPNAWKQIAFKGGSEPGVLNLTTRLTSNQGQMYCVSATWNSADQTLNEEGLSEIYRRFIIELEDE